MRVTCERLNSRDAGLGGDGQHTAGGATGGETAAAAAGGETAQTSGREGGVEMQRGKDDTDVCSAGTVRETRMRGAGTMDGEATRERGGEAAM